MGCFSLPEPHSEPVSSPIPSLNDIWEQNEDLYPGLLGYIYAWNFGL